MTGDIVVAPRSEDDVIRVLAAAYAEDIPVTVRGSGTGNYGQAMPLAGGIVMDVTGLAEIEAIDPGAVAVGAGAILARIDEATRRDISMELRMHPSTYKTASIGGFVAGGSGGVGSINWGGLRDLGNVLRLQDRHDGGQPARARPPWRRISTRRSTPMASTASSPRSRCR